MSVRNNPRRCAQTAPPSVRAMFCARYTARYGVAAVSVRQRCSDYATPPRHTPAVTAKISIQRCRCSQRNDIISRRRAEQRQETATKVHAVPRAVHAMLRARAQCRHPPRGSGDRLPRCFLQTTAKRHTRATAMRATLMRRRHGAHANTARRHAQTARSKWKNAFIIMFVITRALATRMF